MKTASTILLTFILVFTFSAAHANDWQPAKSDFGIDIEYQYLPDSPWRVFRGEIEVASKPDQLVRFLQDLNALPDWHYRTKSAEVLEMEGFSSALIHIVTKPLWPVKQRDVVCRVSLTLDPDSDAIFISLESVDDVIPPIANSIRMEKLNAKWTIKPLGEARSTVRYETHVEPGGDMPIWLFNTVAMDVPLYSLLNLRRNFEDDKRQNRVDTINGK